MAPLGRTLAALTLTAAVVSSSRGHAKVPDVLASTGGLPPDIVGQFREPIGFQQSARGSYLVFDRRGHTVYGVDRSRDAATKLVEIGQEPGRIIEATAFDTADDGSFVVADVPRGIERVQVFSASGTRLGGFNLPGRATARVSLAGVMFGGVGSLQYSGRSVVMNQPETGALITEYGLAGTPTRSVGVLRPTGHEGDRDLHLALNTGLPLAIPGGGFYFVFQAGVPQVRRYDATGRLVFERHIEGREIDGMIGVIPDEWPRGTAETGTIPVVPPVVRTAAVDPQGQLWIAFAGVPYTFVYDAEGDKARVVQFRATSILRPTSLFFTSGGRLLVTPGCYEFRP